MENNNSVCYVAEIAEIKPIEGADRLELAIIGGWSCVVQKGLYKPKDRVVVATTDAVVPESMATKLGVSSYLRKGNRVRTVKLRGVYSECLIIPLSHIPYKGIANEYFEGKDMMGVMNIFKYEPPVKMVQLASGRKIRYQDNPNFHVYYKFPNMKNVPDMFTSDDYVEITRKIHGTNARFGIVKKRKLSFLDRVKLTLSKYVKKWRWVEYEFAVGSHNVEKGSDSQGFYDTNVWYEVADKFKIKQRLWDYVKGHESPESIGAGMVLYGEIYGPGIQKGYDYGLTELDFFVFDMTMNNEYVFTLATNYITEKGLGLKYAEVLYEGKWNQAIQNSFVYDNYVPLGGKQIPHEGIVVKHHTGDRSKVAKVINPDYLIYSEKHNVGDSH